MKNINKDYLVTVNAKNATVSAPGAMSFYITDILTSNIFFQLVFSESNNPLIISYAPNEDASNYTLTLRVVKPNNEPKEIEVVLLDQNSNFFIADLTEDFIDVLGTYECELFIDTEINGRPERSTTNSFTYTVKPSIFSNAEDIINTNYLSIDNIATKDYVNQLLVGGDVDLDGYVTDEELAEALANIDTGDIDLSAYATTTYVDSEISAIELTPGPKGEQGIQGEMGPEGPAGKDGVDGVTPVKGVDYFTEEDIASIKEGLVTTDDIVVIGGEEETYIFTPDDIEADIYQAYLLKNVQIVDDIYEGELVMLESWMDEEYKGVTIYRIDGYYCEYKQNDSNEFEMIGFDNYAWNSQIDDIRENYATTESVNTALNSKADSEHTHDNYLTAVPAEYITETELNDALANLSGDDIVASNIVATNSISMGRKEGTTIGSQSIAMGHNVEASGTQSHAEGFNTIASGWRAHAEGDTTRAKGSCSHTEGTCTVALGNDQHVQGKYNIEDTEKKYAHIVGNGNDTERSNAHTLDWEGNGWYQGNLYVGGTSQDDANKVLSTADIKFTEDGKLSVTINGVTKTFSPD